VNLLLVVPDRNWEAVMGAILARPEALAIQPVPWVIRRHPGKDSGVCRKGAQLAASLSRQHTHALLIFDHDGCGDRRPPAEIERRIRGELKRHWADRGEAVVVSPELELWIWRARAQIARELGITKSEMLLQLEEGGVSRGRSQQAHPAEGRTGELASRRQEGKVVGRLREHRHASKPSRYALRDGQLPAIRNHLAQLVSPVAEGRVV